MILLLFATFMSLNSIKTSRISRKSYTFATGNRMKSGKHIRWMTKPQQIKEIKTTK